MHFITLSLIFFMSVTQQFSIIFIALQPSLLWCQSIFVHQCTGFLIPQKRDAQSKKELRALPFFQFFLHCLGIFNLVKLFLRPHCLSLITTSTKLYQLNILIYSVKHNQGFTGLLPTKLVSTTALFLSSPGLGPS
jgi:hypothetical protein